MEHAVLLPAPGDLPIFECYHRGRTVGLVWECQGAWYADANRIHSGAIRADDQMTAALMLIDSLVEGREAA